MKNKKKASWGSLVRLLDYMWKQYKFVLILAAVLIVAASLSTVYITSSIRALVDQYIQPMLFEPWWTNTSNPCWIVEAETLALSSAS